jgi:hypothetical protein
MVAAFGRHEKAWSFSLESEMKCFELTENVTTGLSVMVDPCDDVVFRLGAQQPTDIPIGRGFVELLREAGVKGEVRLKWADVLEVESTLKIARERDRGDQRALLAVRTAPPQHGKMYCLANSYDEVEQNGRVSREFRPFPSLGVTVIAEGKCIQGDDCWDEKLLLLSPGASFRVVRKGRLEGAAPEIVVAWNGRDMHAHVPKKFRQNGNGDYAPRP